MSLGASKVSPKFWTPPFPHPFVTTPPGGDGTSRVVPERQSVGPQGYGRCSRSTLTGLLYSGRQEFIVCLFFSTSCENQHEGVESLFLPEKFIRTCGCVWECVGESDPQTKLCTYTKVKHHLISPLKKKEVFIFDCDNLRRSWCNLDMLFLPKRILLSNVFFTF